MGWEADLSDKFNMKSNLDDLLFFYNYLGRSSTRARRKPVTYYT